MNVVGDPAAMRAAAARLQLRAEQLGAAGARLEAQVGSMVYEGPAADRLRASTVDRRQRLQVAAGRLQDLAATLMRSAADVEAAQLEAVRLQLVEIEAQLDALEDGPA
jgi:hypothetical protein